MSWETVIGLEVHAELSTKSKIFCACSTVFGDEPNIHVCPVCSGMPGSLPRLNRAVLDYAIRLGLALNCSITKISKFDRKNYFYPDLPKAYQISQLYAPICYDGYMALDDKTFRIKEIHMEEDAGKLIHTSAGTQMDFNRCGVPLLEIVSEPDFRSSDELIAYLERLREMLIYLDICDGKMQEGSMRVDVNLSMRQAGEEMGTRTETKNLNSFKAIERAVKYEIARQKELLEEGRKITQETRRWDDDRGVSYAMRSKEDANDYRYFPEPDLLPLVIDDAWLEAIRNSLPELAHQKRARYIKDFGITEQDALILSTHIDTSTLFESLAEESGEALEAAHLIIHQTKQIADTKKLAKLIKLVTKGKISRNAYKEAVHAVVTQDVEPEQYISEKGLLMDNNEDAIKEAVNNVLADNQNALADYKAGKVKAFAFLMGQTMKKLGGSGNPELTKKILKEALEDAD